jgi:hypothetical protein
MRQDKNSAHSNEPLQIFVNTDYHNEATLNVDMEQDIKMFESLSWRSLIKDVLRHSLRSSEAKDLLEIYGLDQTSLDEAITESAWDKYYENIRFSHDNYTGASARLFKLLRDSGVFDTDIDGNVEINGCGMSQTTHNGPRKIVTIANEKSVCWLTEELRKNSIFVEMVFV